MDIPQPISFPEGTVNLVRDLVPAVRALLGRGLPDDFQRACVRIGDFRQFGGGLKSSLVGGLRIDVNAVLKLGGPDLVLHECLMKVVNAVRPRTFPAVLARVELDARRQFLLMEDLRKYATVLDLVYHEGLPARAIERIFDQVIEALLALRETGATRSATLRGIPKQPDPFSARLCDKLRAVLAADPVLKPLMEKPGEVMGLPCPPLKELLGDARRFLAAAAPRIQPVLQHGDPHLGNLMVRARGKGWSVRLIDPNPEVGFTDPLYDVGKLFHWADPVGWAHVTPETCHATWRCCRSGWDLDARHESPNAAAERRREHLLACLQERIHRLLPDESQAAWRARLPLATAAAHVGLAALLKGDTQRAPRRFVLAHTLRHLAEWRCTLGDASL